MSGGRDDGDTGDSVFRKSVADVRPLEGRDKLRPPPRTLRRRKPRETHEGVSFETERLGEHVEGIAAGIDRAQLLRLRNGEVRPDERVDLHGMIESNAQRRVREVVTRVHGAGGRCVLIVHGRGRHSAGEPVLKEALFEWLTAAPLASLVMAFTSAAGRDGGVGATYVLLRRDR
jgi:DNA-nicking Smr family endonuclease